MSMQNIWYQRLPLSAQVNPAVLTERVRRRANIGRVHWETNFASIPNSAPYKKPIQDYCTAFEVWEQQGLGLILFGDWGSGKTTLGTLVLKYCLAKGGRSLSYRYSALIEKLTQFKAQFAPNGAPLEIALTNVNCLLIDDFEIEEGRQRGERLRKLETILRRRYDENLPTIITTNQEKKKLFEVTWLKSMIQNSYLGFPITGIEWRKNPPLISHNGNLL